MPRENRNSKTCTPKFIAMLFTITRTGKQCKCPSMEGWIKKMWHIYTMEYHSATKKERNWVICRDVDGHRDCHSEWSKSEREKQILNINTYMWNLKKKWYKGSYLQSRIKRHRHREQMYGYQRGKGEMGWAERLGLTYIYIYHFLLCIKQNRELYSVLCGDLNEKEIQKKEKLTQYCKATRLQ